MRVEDCLITQGIREMPEKIGLISCPTRPDSIYFQKYTDEETLRQERRKFELLTLRTADGQSIKIVDKSSPHSQYDLMIVADGTTRPLCFAELSPELLGEVSHSIATFAQYTSSPEIVKRFGLENCTLSIASNIDRGIQDRYTIQGERTLHVHMLTVPITPYNEVSSYTIQNSLTKIGDPLYTLGPHLLEELIFSERSPFHDMLCPDEWDLLEKTGRPGQLRIRGGWNTVGGSEFGTILSKFDSAISAAHGYISSMIINNRDVSKQFSWERPTLNTQRCILEYIEADRWLTSETKKRLISFSSKLRNISPTTLRWMESRRQKDRNIGFPEMVLGYVAPTYTITLLQNCLLGEINTTKDVYIRIQPLLVRAAGAAGLVEDYKGRFHLVTKNGSGVFSDEQMRRRREFQAGYLSCLQNSYF